MACGVYYLWDGERVLYVGASLHVETRLRRHANEGLIPFIQAFFDACSPEELAGKECEAIREFRPVLNEHNARNNDADSQLHVTNHV